MKIASLLVIKKRRHFEIIGHVIDIFTNVDMINNSLCVFRILLSLYYEKLLFSAGNS